MTRFAAFADLALLALAAVDADAVAMVEARAAVASVHSLTHVETGRRSRIGSGAVMTRPAASSHVVLAGKTARCSGETGFGQVDIDSSNSVPGIVVANTVAAAAAAAAAAAVAAVSDPAAVRRQIAAVETSVEIGVFAGIGAFAVAAAGSFAAAVAAVAVVAERIVVDGCSSAVHVVATGPDGFAGFAVAVGSRRKVRPWVAAAASGRPRLPSAPAHTPRIGHSRPADRPRMEAA